VLSFDLFRIPVSIQPSFLLIAVVLGWTSGFGTIEGFVTWVLIVFISILIHELGHAVVARSFGAAVEIELNGFGGLTRWGVTQGELPPGRRAAVAAAGSATGLVFGGLIWLLYAFLGPFAGLGGQAGRLLIYVNVFWGLLNWLPIRPLDGGHLLMALLSKTVPRQAPRVARVVFTVTAALALLASIRFGLLFIGILSAWLLLGELGAGRREPATSGLPALSYDQPEEERPESDPSASEPATPSPETDEPKG
jgi:Zn-dependent protease